MMRFKSILTSLLLPVCALLGGFLAEAILHPTPSLASAGSVQTAPMFIYGQDGQVRLQMGTYTAAGEAGLPMVGLSDNHGRLRLLLRLAGANEAPVIVMKDTQGRDRMVFGLGLNGTDESPFLSVVDAQGRRRNLLAE